MTRDREATETSSRWNGAPRSAGEAADAVLAARGEPRRLKRIFERSPVPALMFDAQRWHLEANRPARLWFRRSLEEIRTYALGDLAPPEQLGLWERLWAQLLETGFVADRYQGTKPDGSPIDVFYCALADVLPGRHVIVFAPADWPEDELGVIEDDGPDPSASLTPREVEILTLAGQSLSVRTIAESLTISPATVKTHLEHIYRKLDVHDRTAAVVHALRAGFIE
ncbi:MAG TPA: LuxR C-terminal-related transcriptional regulator [Solirubrobacteraceae bacterium]|jgi:DNA-binding CsgD family transcriptional regulator|nr:LuxR C-terminal-related transcriptional regulator [Solirubrobacteraceae bacterium]